VFSLQSKAVTLSYSDYLDAYLQCCFDLPLSSILNISRQRSRVENVGSGTLTEVRSPHRLLLSSTARKRIENVKADKTPRSTIRLFSSALTKHHFPSIDPSCRIRTYLVPHQSSKHDIFRIIACFERISLFTTYRQRSHLIPSLSLSGHFAPDCALWVTVPLRNQYNGDIEERRRCDAFRSPAAGSRSGGRCRCG